jgi:Ser/Thr protein kinase RdoA (MazF antagonist)
MSRRGCEAFCTGAVRRSQPRCGVRGRADIGIAPSGRLFALNSYENRVYQLGDDDGVLWVLKFYRPARWSDAQIAEEHDFTLELAAAELPVAAPIVRDGVSLFEHRRLRFAAFPYLAGRAPELDDPATLTLLGRTLARIHAIGGRARAFSTGRR